MKVRDVVKDSPAWKELFPDVNLLASKRSKKPHEGMIDAILIAEWGKRNYEKVAK